MSVKKLDRRTFLMVSAATTAAAGLAACGGTPAPAAPTQAPEATTPPAEATAPAATTAPASPAASRFKEAPMLAEMVAAGQLPPVEERLPANPVVVQMPGSTIGQHGGVWTRADVGPAAISSRAGAEGFLHYGPLGQGLEPNVAERYEINEDGTEYTFYLREGMRWSDGAPFTADDVLFWYEDVLLNEELTPAFPAWLAPGGVNVVVEKVDDYTVKFIFGVPYGIFLDRVAFSGVTWVNYPKHYFQQFHPNYADAAELEAKIKERGFEAWYQLFGAQLDFQRNPDLPTIHPWKINTADWTSTASADRNPYYFKVDAEGNQLPYIDRITYLIVESAEMIPMRIVTGEVNHQAWSTGISNYTLYMENREAGDYNVYIWSYGGSGTAMQVNQTKMPSDNPRDQEIAELLRNRDFRVGLSKALDRDDINQLVYQGLSDPALEVYPESVKNDPEIQDLYTYDVDAANALLDSIGLDQRDSEGMRLLPSGEQLNLIMIGHISYAIHRDVAEVVTEFWRQVGVRCTMDWIPNETWWPRVQEGDFDIVAYEADYASGNEHYLTYPRSFFPVETSTYWAPRWGTYYATKGRQGDEPDVPDARRLVELYDQILVTVDDEERAALVEEAFRICANNLWPIHTVANRPEPCIVKNGFMNVPEQATMAYPVWGEKTTKPEQYWIQQA